MEVEPQFRKWGNPAAPDSDAPYFGTTDSAFQMQCLNCTFINVGRETCEMCDANLFKD